MVRIGDWGTISSMDVKEARVAVGRLFLTLREIAKKDQEQDVMGIAVPILDMVVSAAREHVLPGDPVLDRLPELFSSDMSDPWGDSIRAVDALIAVEQLQLALDRAIAAAPSEPLQFIPEPGPFDRY